eukprot:GEZU01001506.1.p1 GENE.GEZU01001506.1~~GEZU01001506.1.p1  ORF type:complete len:183 (+),score=14.84 GEZU01001506.1:92-640(+)
MQHAVRSPIAKGRPSYGTMDLYTIDLSNYPQEDVPTAKYSGQPEQPAAADKTEEDSKNAVAGGNHARRKIVCCSCCGCLLALVLLLVVGAGLGAYFIYPRGIPDIEYKGHTIDHFVFDPEIRKFSVTFKAFFTVSNPNYISVQLTDLNLNIEYADSDMLLGEVYEKKLSFAPRKRTVRHSTI